MQSALHTTDDGTLELTITIPWSSISQTYEKVISDLVRDAELAGFRKGKAPRKLVEENLNKAKVYEETIKQVVPQAYTEAVNEHKLRPILMPQVELKEAKEGNDWVVVARTCQTPQLTLGNYQQAIRDLKASKRAKIYVPGKSDKDEGNKDRKPTLEEILEVLVGSVTITLAEVLVEHETNHRLSQLIDQTRKLGLTVEQYLASTNRTADSLRAEYTKQARQSLTVEFALEAIAEAEKITVEEKEIDTIIAGAKTDEEKKTLENQRYYLASLLRRQKTLDFLAQL